MGIEHITKLRMSGIHPKIITIYDEPIDRKALAIDPTLISIYGQAIELLDLRCVVGLMVSASSPCPDRVKKLFDLCCENGAAVVAACQAKQPRERKNDDWIRISKQPHIARHD